MLEMVPDASAAITKEAEARKAAAPAAIISFRISHLIWTFVDFTPSRFPRDGALPRSRGCNVIGTGRFHQKCCLFFDQKAPAGWVSGKPNGLRAMSLTAEKSAEPDCDKLPAGPGNSRRAAARARRKFGLAAVR